ncbi:MAG: tetratricopeptide repeat protein [Leptolyngbyaceae cyanobacterium CRU_2_3]|nr:tetratricopeptide repeat protein [Leptolyngbyaceae cyanobacterium CRU_2_3]
MDDRLLPIIYLSVLVVLLAGASWFLIRQILKTRRTEMTLAKLQNKLAQGKGTAQEHYELGSLLLDKRIYSQAIAQFQKALKAKDLQVGEPTALIYNALGFAHAAQAQFDLAIKQYKEALEQFPEYSTALNNLGFAYEKKQLTTQALEAYEHSLRINPQSKIAQRRVASLRKRLVLS